MSRLGILLTAAFWEGFFLAVNCKIGHDISPTGLGNTILTAFEPIIGEQLEGIATFVKLILFVIPILLIVVVITKFGIVKGSLIFLVVTIASFLFFFIMIV